MTPPPSAPNRRLRILLHTRASGGGGAERVFATLAEALAARGHLVTLAVDHHSGGTAPAGVELVVLGAGHGRGVVALAGLLRRGAFDVAAAAVSVSCVKLAAARTMAMQRTPFVVSFHGFEEHRTGRLSALAYRGLPLLSRMAARVVAVSDGLREALVSRWGSLPDRTVRIYNPVALREIDQPDEADLMARPPLVAAVGRLSPEKGMDDLLAAFALVRHKGARLVIGGDGPDREALGRQAGTLRIADRVTFLGAIDGPAAAFATARVAVCPSRTEAFGMAVVEALAYGLPVVATACDGPREILGDGRFGVLTPIGDAAAMAEAIEAALDRPGDPSARIERAAAFSQARGVAAWEDLLRRVAAR
ncbi:MAG TPA: glycosyltransferase [Methylomirabilota bacterium]|nr:glycosyltransferase [Methylomirabilota bacterium]